MKSPSLPTSNTSPVNSKTFHISNTDALDFITIVMPRREIFFEKISINNQNLRNTTPVTRNYIVITDKLRNDLLI